MSDTPDEPDFTKPLSRWSAPHWAMKNGICAALGGDARWAVLSALYTFLPNVKPSRGRLEELTGKARSTVDEARLSLQKIGLIDYDSSRGGRYHTPDYQIADVRRRDIAEAIIERIKKGSDQRQKGSDERTVSDAEKGSDYRQKGSDQRQKGSDYRQKGSASRTRSTQLSSQPSPQAKPVAAVPLLGADGPSDRSGQALAAGTPSACDAQPVEIATAAGHHIDLAGVPSAPAEVSVSNGLAAQHVHSPSGGQQITAVAAFGPALNQDVPQGTISLAPPAEHQRQAITSSKGAKPAKEAKAGKADPLTAEQRAAVCGSAKAMEGYLLWGAAGVGNPAATDLAPSRTNWRRWLEGDDPHVELWTIGAFMGFYWWRVTNYREARRIQITLPMWGRMAGDFKNILKTMPSQTDFFKMLRCICTHFELITWMCGTRIGMGVSLNETSLTNSMIRDKLQVLMSAQKPQLEELYGQMRKALGIE